MKRILYSKIVYLILLIFCRIFYPAKYLKGYYFTEKRAGFLWALKGIPRRIYTGIPWPIGKTTIITNWKNIQFDQDSLNIFQSPGCYFQAINAEIIIGKNVHIAPNVGIVTTNHDIMDLKQHINGEEVIIGDNCWICMNSVILPGVVLNPHTIVAAGSVVTKTIHTGNCIIAGIPAKLLRNIEEYDSVN